MREVTPTLNAGATATAVAEGTPACTLFDMRTFWVDEAHPGRPVRATNSSSCSFSGRIGHSPPYKVDHKANMLAVVPFRALTTTSTTRSSSTSPPDGTSTRRQEAPAIASATTPSATTAAAAAAVALSEESAACVFRTWMTDTDAYLGGLSSRDLYTLRSYTHKGHWMVRERQHMTYCFVEVFYFQALDGLRHLYGEGFDVAAAAADASNATDADRAAIDALRAQRRQEDGRAADGQVGVAAASTTAAAAVTVYGDDRTRPLHVLAIATRDRDFDTFWKPVMRAYKDDLERILRGGPALRQALVVYSGAKTDYVAASRADAARRTLVLKRRRRPPLEEVHADNHNRGRGRHHHDDTAATAAAVAPAAATTVDATAAAAAAAAEEGSTFSPGRMTSTSLNVAPARNFMFRGMYGDHCLYRMTLMPGTKALCVMGVSGSLQKFEYEVLVSSHTVWTTPVIADAAVAAVATATTATPAVVCDDGERQREGEDDDGDMAPPPRPPKTVVDVVVYDCGLR